MARCACAVLLSFVPAALSLQVVQKFGIRDLNFDYQVDLASDYEPFTYPDCLKFLGQNSAFRQKEFDGKGCQHRCDTEPECHGFWEGSTCTLLLVPPVGFDTYVPKVNQSAECYRRKPPVGISYASGGDWTRITCPSGQNLIGGGCSTTNSMMGKSGPFNSTTWECGGHSGDKKATVICSPSIVPSIIKVSGGDWTRAVCPAGQKLLSGGCHAQSSPHKFQYNAPESDTAWLCGGSGAEKTVWAICAPDVDVTQKVQTGLQTSYVSCDNGQKLVGGGCDANDPLGPFIFKSSAPVGFRDDLWECTSQMTYISGDSHKRVWALCVPDETLDR